MIKIQSPNLNLGTVTLLPLLVLAALLPGLAFGQGRIKDMPGYDQFQKIRP
jgi:hypothetical protein